MLEIASSLSAMNDAGVIANAVKQSQFGSKLPLLVTLNSFQGLLPLENV